VHRQIQTWLTSDGGGSWSRIGQASSTEAATFSSPSASLYGVPLAAVWSRDRAIGAWTTSNGSNDEYLWLGVHGGWTVMPSSKTDAGTQGGSGYLYLPGPSTLESIDASNINSTTGGGGTAAAGHDTYRRTQRPLRKTLSQEALRMKLPWYVIFTWPGLLWRAIFPQQLPGSPCLVLAKHGLEVALLPGRLTEPQFAIVGVLAHVHAAANVTYDWIDRTEHTFIVDANEIIGTTRGLSVYPHNVGSLYAANVSNSFIDSDFYNKILKADLGKHVLHYIEDYVQAENMPWLKYAIWAAVAVGVLVLWKTGVLAQVWSEINPNAVPLAPAAAPAGVR